MLMRATKIESKKPNSAVAAVRAQRIFLNEHGQILESDDQIFCTAHFVGKSVIEWFPFFECMWPSLLHSTKNNEATEFKAVQFGQIELPGIYDFKFSVIFFEKNTTLIWTISEQTAQYTALQKRQQANADRKLRQQKRALAQ